MEADARYLATGKRKRSIARVILIPGDGKIEVNKRALEEFFPRPLHQTMARQPLAVDRLRGQRRRPRPRPRRRDQRPGRRGPPRDRPGADRDRPRAARRAQAPRLPDPRRARQGAPQGGAEEGAQAAAVQQALGARVAATARRLFGTDGVRGEAGTFLTAELATSLGQAATASLEARAPPGPDRPRHARVGPDAGGGAGGRDRRRRRGRAAGRGAADPGRRDPRQAPRARPRRGRLRLPQPLPRQRDQVLLGGGHEARRRGRGADRGAAGRRRRRTAARSAGSAS